MGLTEQMFSGRLDFNGGLDMFASFLGIVAGVMVVGAGDYFIYFTAKSQ